MDSVLEGLSASLAATVPDDPPDDLEPAPSHETGFDPVVAEIVRRELASISRVKQHLPPNFDDLPLPIRNRLYGQVEAALTPEPDLGWIEGAEFLEPARDTEWLITDLITKASDGGRILVAGPEKSFKSLFAVGCLVAVASGQPLFGYEPWSVPEAGDVLAFMGEGGREWNRSRVARLMDGLGFSDELKRQTVSRLRMATVPLTPPERFALKIEKQLEERDWKLVIVDSLYVFGGTTERSQLAAMGTLLVKWAELAERSGTTLMVVDHFKKGVEALELASVSGVGASQWAQAWCLMKAEYHHAIDTTSILVKTGARQSAGGVFKITIQNVMDGPIRAGTEITTEEDEDDEEPKTEAEKLAVQKLDKLIAFNHWCDENPGWQPISTVGAAIGLTNATREHILEQPHVGIATSRNGSKKWVCTTRHDKPLPPDMPEQGPVLAKNPVIPTEPTTTDPTDPIEETE
jgi:hypothetical protein